MVGVDGIKSDHLRHEWLLYVMYPPSSRLVSIILNTMCFGLLDMRLQLACNE